MVSHYAALVSAFKRLRLRDVAAALKDAAQRLCFVEACHTRIILVSGEFDVTRGTEAYQVALSAPHTPPLACLLFAADTRRVLKASSRQRRVLAAT